MQCKTKLGGIAMLFALGAGVAQAAPADRGWYAGLDVGRSNLRLNGSDLDGVFANQGITSSTSIDGHDTNLGANVGYRLNRNFALEGGYIDFGKFDFNAAANAPGADTIQGDYKAHAWSFSAVGTAPIDNRWSLYAKGGVTRTSADLSASSATGATAPAGASASGTGALLGVGTSYDFTRSLYGKLEADRYTHVGDSNTGRGDIDVYTVGVGLRF
jgi:OOP family OmpA-OmpF porin